MTDKVNAREVVLDMLLEIIEEEKFAHTVLNHSLKKYQSISKQDRAFITRLCTGTVKHYITLDYIINRFASLTVNKMKPLIRNLLRLGVYQIFYMDQVPVSAVCNEAVNLAKKRGFTKLSGFVNGILRNIARKKEEVIFPDKTKKPQEYLSVTYSAPDWLVAELLSQYDFTIVEQLLSASLKEKETTIRCNKVKLTPDALFEMLKEEKVTAGKSEYLDYAFKITGYDHLEGLKSFQEGYFAVQDVSSMLVCQVADMKDTDIVVDVCAAPGGKSMHAAEKAKQVYSRDLTDYKVALIEDNKKRLGFTNVITKVWDATKTDTELLNQADIVIADLPCSGLGVFGKKPDIKYKLSKEQLRELAALQKEILSVVKDYVKPGGILIYSTCTLNKGENIENFNWFLDNYDFSPENLNPYLPKALIDETSAKGYLQLIQGIHNMDGFFISRFRRNK